MPLERVSVRYLQEQARREGRRDDGRTLTPAAAARGPLALGGGGRASTPARAGAAAASRPPEWPQLVAAAKKEGKVVVNTFPGDGYKRALKAFTQAYPDIKLEHTGLHSQDFAPRILQERQANLFTWDVATIPTSTALQVLRPAGRVGSGAPGHRAAGGEGRRGLGGRLRARLRAREGPRARLRLRAPSAAAASPSTPTW